jgi:hypothetical protein
MLYISSASINALENTVAGGVVVGCLALVLQLLAML